MDMHDAIAARGDDVLWGGSCVVPVPRIEQQSDVGTTFLGEREHIVHAPNKFVLVRTDVPLSQVLDLEAAKDRSDPVYLGGPVGPSAVFALFKSSAKMEKAESIFGGVYLISDKALFEQTISARPDPGVFHVYLGYAGWTQDQLRTEAQLGA